MFSEAFEKTVPVRSASLLNEILLSPPSVKSDAAVKDAKMAAASEMMGTITER